MNSDSIQAEGFQNLLHSFDIGNNGFFVPDRQTHVQDVDQRKLCDTGRHKRLLRGIQFQADVRHTADWRVRVAGDADGFAAVLLHSMAPRGTEMVCDYLNFGEEFWSWDNIDKTFAQLCDGKDHAIKFLEPKVDFFTRHPSQFAEK